MDTFNLKLLDVISARTSRLSAAINYVNDTEQRLDLQKIIELTPFLSRTIREVFTEAFKLEMKSNMEILSTLNEYIYGEPPAPEEPEPEVDPTPNNEGNESVSEGNDSETRSGETSETVPDAPTETTDSESGESGDSGESRTTPENGSSDTTSDLPVTEPTTDDQNTESNP